MPILVIFCFTVFLYGMVHVYCLDALPYHIKYVGHSFKNNQVMANCPALATGMSVSDDPRYKADFAAKMNALEVL